MSQPVLNLATLHLADNSTKQFSVEYAPVDTSKEGIVCLLPGNTLTPFVLPPIPPISQTCKFTFPQNTVIPPLYNPPIYIPPACENFTASVNIRTSHAMRNSNFSVESASVPNCRISILGTLAVDACEKFTAKATLTTSDGLDGSTMTVVPSSAPNCGLTIATNLKLDACLNFDAYSNVQIGNNMKKTGSYLYISSESAPNCGLSLRGYIDTPEVQCEYTTFYTDVKVVTYGIQDEDLGYIPDEVLPSGMWTEKNFKPDCGFRLLGDINIPNPVQKILDVWPAFKKNKDILFDSCVNYYCVRIIAPGDPILSPSAIINGTSWNFNQVNDAPPANCDGTKGGGGDGGSGEVFNKEIRCGYYKLSATAPSGFRVVWEEEMPGATRRWWNSACDCPDGAFRTMCEPTGVTGSGCVEIYLTHSAALSLAYETPNQVLSGGAYSFNGAGETASVVIDVTDIGDTAAGEKQEARFRKINMCDADGNQQLCYVLMTLPEDVEATV